MSDKHGISVTYVSNRKSGLMDVFDGLMEHYRSDSQQCEGSGSKADEQKRAFTAMRSRTSNFPESSGQIRAQDRNRDTCGE